MKLKLLFFTILFSTLGWGQAILPFSYDGGNPGTTITGLTQSGLGTNYAASPMMKFDTTGDNLILNFSGVPNVLNYDVKGNPGSGTAISGIFEIYESSDGISYTLLRSIVNKSNVVTTYIDSPASSTRFIKWAFTSKSTGNIGLGKINLTESSVASPEIDIAGNSVNITAGDTTPQVLDFTDFGTVAVGSPLSHSFVVSNNGTANLTVSSIAFIGGNAADFNVTSSPVGSIGAGLDNNLTITFTPSAPGIRTTIVRIVNNDSNENSFEFIIKGNGSCSAGTISGVYPISGPEGTEVTINVSSGDLSGAIVTFSGVAATVISNTASQVVVAVPVGASTGNIEITNAISCKAVTAFTVIKEDKSSCDGSSSITDLFISEVTDASLGSLSYVEIYNATGATVDMANYEVRIRNNGNVIGDDIPLVGALLNGQSFVLATSLGTKCNVSGGNGILANQHDVSSGVNDNDCIHLAKNGTVIDIWGVCDGSTWIGAAGLGTKGYDFERKNNVTAPNATFTMSDWTITDWDSCSDDYSNIASYVGVSTPPTVTSPPTLSLTCTNTNAVLSVSATEGFAGGQALAYQWYVVAPNTTTWMALSNGGVYSDVTSNALTISSIIGLDNYQYYCQVRENTATCYTATVAVKIKDNNVTTWNGMTWSNGTPSLSKKIILNGNYNTTANGNIEACSLVVNTGFTATITAGNYFNIQNNLTVDGNLQIQNQGSLVMINDGGIVTNNGTIQVHKATTPFERYDYTYWSSPVVNTTIGLVLPDWRLDYVFRFEPANFIDLYNSKTGMLGTDGFDDDGNDWVYVPSGTVMTPGKGYIAMGPTSGTFPMTKSVVFDGTINNGIINQPIGLSGNAADANDDWNLIGNPYPSAIYANDFINMNANISGTLYFWTHVDDISATNPGPDLYNFSSNDYAMYNLSGGTKSASNSVVPTGYVTSGQGFLIEANTAGTIMFNNSMRNKTHPNNQFFRAVDAVQGTDVKNRFWLSMRSATGMYSQQLIGYFDQATTEVDRGYDGLKSEAKNYIAFYSLIKGMKYAIQGRNTFDGNDTVPIGYFAASDGTYTIEIDDLEGIFATQTIYLQDFQTGIIHDLKTGKYSFSTAAGNFENRFIIRYTDEKLHTNEFVAENAISIYVNNGVVVESKQEIIKEVVVYDVLGRVVAQQKNRDSNAITINAIRETQSVLIVKVILMNNEIITKEVMY